MERLIFFIFGRQISIVHKGKEVPNFTKVFRKASYIYAEMRTKYPRPEIVNSELCIIFFRRG
jgi:hypothetical protein